MTLDIAIIGTGYVGLTSGACFAHLGHNVTCVDINEQRIENLRAGHVDIFEAGLDDLVVEGVAKGRLRFVTDGPHAVADADVVFLCLPTPHSENGGLDLRFVEQALDTIGPHMRPGAVVVAKSTVPVGTNEALVARLGRDDVHVAANPEFLREGTAVSDFLHPDRVVIGVSSEAAARTMTELYEPIDTIVYVTDPTSAELIKYAANAFLATKVSFINEMARLCDKVGADVGAVSVGIGSDHRIGSTFLRPGPGWGGSCFPKDTRGLAHIADLNQVDMPVISAAIQSNDCHLDHVIATLDELAGHQLKGSRIAVWGVAFKAGTDDCRDSPAVDIIERLLAKGADIALYDPAASFERSDVERFSNPYSACDQADLLIVLTEWPEFATADLDKVALLLNSTTVYDTRNVIDPSLAEQAGLCLTQMGTARASALV